MARHRSRAHAPLPWAAIPGMRSLYEHLLERLARLPRDSAGVLLRSAAALLRQVAAALLRLLRGPAQAGLPTSKNARPQRGGNPPVRPGAQGGEAVKGAFLGDPEQAGAPISKKPRREPAKLPVVPGTQGGDAVKRPCLGGPEQAGAPIIKKARHGPGEPPVRPGTQGGDAVQGACHGGSEQTGAPISEMALRGPGKPPVRPGTQGGDAVKGPCFAAPDSASGVNKVSVLDGAEVPELAESDPPVAKNSCSEFGEAQTTSTTPDDSIADWKTVMRKKRSKIAPQFPLQVKECTFYKKDHLARDYPRTSGQVQSYQEKCCSYCKKEGHLARDCPGIKPSNSPISGCDPIKTCCHRKAKDEEKYNLDTLFAEEEEDAETKAHRMYHVKVCKKDHILCLACHLSGKEVLLKNKEDAVRRHFENKHGPCYHWCDKKGCLAVAETKHDMGMHMYIFHGI